MARTVRFVESLGSTVKQIRKRSTYRDLTSFARQAGISKEGLRKIELGDRLPSRDSLEGILRAGEVPKKQASEMLRQRDIAHAEREGLPIPSADGVDTDQLAEKAMEIFTTFLDGCDLALSEEDQADILNDLEVAFREHV